MLVSKFSRYPIAAFQDTSSIREDSSTERVEDYYQYQMRRNRKKNRSWDLKSYNNNKDYLRFLFSNLKRVMNGTEKLSQMLNSINPNYYPDSQHNTPSISGIPIANDNIIMDNNSNRPTQLEYDLNSPELTHITISDPPNATRSSIDSSSSSHYKKNYSTRPILDNEEVSSSTHN